MLKKRFQSRILRKTFPVNLRWAKFKSLQKDMALRARSIGIYNKDDVGQLVDEIRRVGRVNNENDE